MQARASGEKREAKSGSIRSARANARDFGSRLPLAGARSHRLNASTCLSCLSIYRCFCDYASQEAPKFQRCRKEVDQGSSRSRESVQNSRAVRASRRLAQANQHDHSDQRQRSRRLRFVLAALLQHSRLPSGASRLPHLHVGRGIEPRISRRRRPERHCAAHSRVEISLARAMHRHLSLDAAEPPHGSRAGESLQAGQGRGRRVLWPWPGGLLVRLSLCARARRLAGADDSQSGRDAGARLQRARHHAPVHGQRRFAYLGTRRLIALWRLPAAQCLRAHFDAGRVDRRDGTASAWARGCKARMSPG